MLSTFNKCSTTCLILNCSDHSQIGQDLWGKSGSGRTPPGLAGNAASGSGWPATTSSGGAGGNPSNGWSSGQNGFEGQGWLLLRNLTPQIDGSTLKTLCIQHGPLQHFDLYLNHSIALVKYKSGEEAVKVGLGTNASIGFSL